MSRDIIWKMLAAHCFMLTSPKAYSSWNRVCKYFQHQQFHGLCFIPLEAPKNDNNDEDDEQQPATESSTSSPILTFLSTRESTNTGAVFVLGKGDFNIDIVVDIKIYMDIGSHVDIDVDACIAIAIQVMMIMMKIT